MKKDHKPKAAPPESKKIKITKPVAGRFTMSENIGDVIEINEKQAEELVDFGYAEYVK
jgi:hypothetical protein